MTDRITLVIPTRNRLEFLRRLLYYYRELGFQGTICIGDASDAWHAKRNKSMLNSLHGELNLKYLRQPDPQFSLCFKQLGESVTTPYTACVNDDNILTPEGLRRCVEFLDNHGDYAAAAGVAAMFRLESSGPYGKLKWVGRYPLRAIEAETAYQRLIDYLHSPFVTVFSVHRTEAWRGICRNLTLPVDWFFADEVLPCWLSVIQGKIKQLDCLYLAFQDHDQRTRTPDIFDCITSPTWASSYRVFRDCVAEELARRDGISLKEAAELVKRAWWFVLAWALTKKWEARYGRSSAWRMPESALRAAARSVPGLRSVGRIVRSWSRRKEDRISLPALLRPSSPYHADFMPIYRAVTSPRSTSAEVAVGRFGAAEASVSRPQR